MIVLELVMDNLQGSGVGLSIGMVLGYCYRRMEETVRDARRR